MTKLGKMTNADDNSPFLIINFDGFNLGFADCFGATFFELDSLEDCELIAEHWNKWINENAR